VLAALTIQNLLNEPMLPLAVGGAVAALLILIVVIRERGKTGLDRPSPVKTGFPAVVNAGEDEETFANRRSSSRREGQPVRVLITMAGLRGQLESGWVLDRSTGGLRIAVAKPIPIGSTIQIRTDNAPDTIPWVSVIVRSSRAETQHHELGCSFESTPPWNVLLLFG
jgi:hypothetical protein